MNLAGIDVNLVVALDALLQERSVTEAAKRIGLSQPAMSHALARLRETLGDPLLVRVGRTMTLTPRAEALVPRARAVVEELEALLAPLPSFDPKTSRRTFKLGATDYVQFVLLPALEEILSREAPNLTLHILPIGVPPASESLCEGEIDVAVGRFEHENMPLDVRRVSLFQDTFVGVAREGHPRARGKLDLATYAELSHVLVSPRGKPGGIVDGALAKKGLVRHVALTVPHFLVVPHIVATSNHVTTMLAHVAATFTTLLPLATFEPPPELDLAPVTMTMVWHERTHEDPGARWLRDALVRAARPLAQARGSRSDKKGKSPKAPLAPEHAS
ncbi:LysR family transcriptional regulator [Polyangium jinanense]|uniref:LysR family transcriptional regulator n=1 Tax=Polyangium jinanense TaxID=2829994 RepID=A0A9X4AXF5_9BACT|nr:LysR family transcriptional regulator [Polyangium jinanense]MDC3959994.1 LysR family transcriptional regulator [Polyangium jinanense]MDC3986212.1 LysR family transcriptional regulator [Polyangium jinanense]